MEVRVRCLLPTHYGLLGRFSDVYGTTIRKLGGGPLGHPKVYINLVCTGDGRAACCFPASHNPTLPPYLHLSDRINQGLVHAGM